MSEVTALGAEAKGRQQVLPSWGRARDGAMGSLFGEVGVGCRDGGGGTAYIPRQAWGGCHSDLCTGRGLAAAAGFPPGTKLPCHGTGYKHFN